MSIDTLSDKPEGRITMKQIAEKAGVSIAAVSMALNNKKGVSREKADDLKRIAREMGYLTEQPTKLHQHSINLIQPIKSEDHRNDLYGILIAEFLQAIAVEAGTQDFGLEIYSHETDDISEIVEIIRSSGRDGSVILGASLDQKDVETLASIDNPVVIVEGFDRGVHADMVSINNDQAIHDLVFYLYEKGHRKIGLVQDESFSLNLNARETAFFYYLEKAGLDFNKEWYYKIPADERGSVIMRDHLASSKNRPSALLCVNDIMAYQCSYACQDLGLKIPNDMAITGFDDLPASRMMRPRLTTVRVSRALLARRTMQLLSDRILTGPEKPPEHVSVGGIVIQRESA